MIKIRPATESDLQDIISIHVESWKDAYADVLPAEFIAGQLHRELARHWRETEIQNQDIVLVAEQDSLVGFASSAIVIGMAFIKESVPFALAGTVSGISNMGMEMGPMILQPIIGLILDLRWDGLLENGIRIYDLNAYHLAFGVIIGLCILGTILITFARETFCQQLQK